MSEENPTPETPKDKLRKIGEKLFADLTPSPLSESFTVMNEVYQGLRQGGFTENEACKIVAYGIFGGVAGGDTASD